MSTNTNSPHDPELLKESQREAREILESALDEIAEAAYTINFPLDLLPKTAEDDVEFDENDLKKTGHPTLMAIAKVVDAIYAALETLPPAPEEDKEDEEG